MSFCLWLRNCSEPLTKTMMVLSTKKNSKARRAKLSLNYSPLNRARYFSNTPKISPDVPQSALAGMLGQRRAKMPIFMTQGGYTQSAVTEMIARPESRAEAVERIITAAGGKLHSYYMTFGEYDFLSIIEAPDEKTVLAALAVSAAGGGVTDLKTTVAVNSADMRDAFERAKSLAPQVGGVVLPRT